jgi:acyl dehydratase
VPARSPRPIGDTLSAIVEVTESRAASTGHRGVVRTTVSVRNQDDEEVLVYTPVRLIRGQASGA